MMASILSTPTPRTQSNASMDRQQLKNVCFHGESKYPGVGRACRLREGTKSTRGGAEITKVFKSELMNEHERANSTYLRYFSSTFAVARPFCTSIRSRCNSQRSDLRSMLLVPGTVTTALAMPHGLTEDVSSNFSVTRAVDWASSS